MRVPFTYISKGKSGRSYYYGGTSTVTTVSHIETSETVSGVRRKKPLGWMEPTNYSFTRNHFSAAVGRVGFVNSRRKYDTVGVVGGGTGARFWSSNSFSAAYIFDPNSAFTSLDNTALIKARNAFQDSKVNYGQAIAEANQTARLVGDSCKRILSAVRALRRGDAKGVAKYLSKHKKPPRKFVKKIKKTISAAGIRRNRQIEDAAEALRKDKSIRNMKNVTGAWLELQYGWKPLLSDIEGSIHNLTSYDRTAWIITAKGSARSNIDLSKRSADHYKGNYASGYCDVKGKILTKYILIGIPSTTPTSFASDMGISNLPLVGWELIPFSFVADWLVPVGPWLDSLDSTVGYDELRSVRIRFAEIDWNEYGDMSAPHFPEVYMSEFTGSKKLVYHTRVVSAGVPLPTYPPWKNPLSYAHMANGLALLVQIFGPKGSTVR